MNARSYIVYNLLEKEVPYPEELLREGEKILLKSKLRELKSYLSGITTSIQLLDITVTNQRMIIATNNFGFKKYKSNSMEVNFNQDGLVVEIEENILRIKFNKHKVWEVYVDDIEKIKQIIPQSVSDNTSNYE